MERDAKNEELIKENKQLVAKLDSIFNYPFFEK